MRIFILDTFKQIVAQFVVHFINIYLSKKFFGNKHNVEADECAIYFITFLIDLFPGLVIMFMLSKLYDKTFEKCGFKRLVSGNYIRDVGGVAIVSYGAYWAQVLLWLSITMISKTINTLIEFYFIRPFAFFANLCLKIFEFSADLKLFFVLIIFPLFANICIFWISDSLLKKKKWDPEDVNLQESFYEEVDSKII